MPCNRSCCAAVQSGNLISLKPRGSGGASGTNPSAGDQWEQWPEEAAVSVNGHASEDDDLQRAIAASLADPAQGKCHEHCFLSV